MKTLGLKALLIVVLLFLVALSFSSLEAVPQPQKTTAEKQPEKLMVEVSRQNGTIDQVPLEEYVIGVVSAEMPVSFASEALKAQAVASRTFVMARHLKVDDTVSSQVYYDVQTRKENWGVDYIDNEQKIKEAVMATAGEVLTYNGEYISALFFSSSNGKTENNDDYFASAEIPYLRSVDSKWDLSFDGTYRSQRFSLTELNSLFNTDHFTLEILSYKDSGRVDEVEVSGTIYSGREIREKLGLASSDFDVYEDNGDYVFETVGYGHGVGMSQYGADGMALDGYDYQAILKHYYQGVTIEKISSQ